MRGGAAHRGGQRLIEGGKGERIRQIQRLEEGLSIILTVTLDVCSKIVGGAEGARVRNAESRFLPTDSCHPHVCMPALLGQQFLESTASQLTYHGLCELNMAVNEGDFCVFFRNNHFNSLTKKQVISTLLKVKVYIV